ncbi:hypothetical protein BV20DRAFT_964336 [Pilatotrama ljubarskyi]|nr:hypothetical protein BV20DRAFT_964336 [Pilatotrama ljubarskyi]
MWPDPSYERRVCICARSDSVPAVCAPNLVRPHRPWDHPIAHAVHHSDSPGRVLPYLRPMNRDRRSRTPCHRHRPRPSSQAPSAPSSSRGSPSTPSGMCPIPPPRSHPVSRLLVFSTYLCDAMAKRHPALSAVHPFSIQYHAADHTRTSFLMRAPSGTPGLRGAARSELSAAWALSLSSSSCPVLPSGPFAHQICAGFAAKIPGFCA